MGGPHWRVNEAETYGKPVKVRASTEKFCASGAEKMHLQSLASLFDWCKLRKSSKPLLRAKQGEGVVSWSSCVFVSLRLFSCRVP